MGIAVRHIMPFVFHRRAKGYCIMLEVGAMCLLLSSRSTIS